MSINAAGLKIFLSCKPCDMRKSIESLAIVVKSQLEMDPFDNSLYVFCNRTCDKCKILHWSNNGWWLYYRKLSRGVFRWKFYENKRVLEVSERQFRWLLDGLSMDQPTAHKSVNQRIIL
ncbi:MAG: IS66 family insertion sequence element accessory protein TnpB [Desulfitobacterium sp.]